MRISFLVIVVLAYIIEVILEATQNSLTLGRMIWLLACLFCLAMFLTEIVFITKQTPTIDILNKTNEVIDFSTLVYNFQMLYYVQAVNLILLIAFLFPFFQFLTDIQSTLNVITNIGSLIVLFGCLWWAFAVMFAYVITNTWGY